MNVNSRTQKSNFGLGIVFTVFALIASLCIWQAMNTSTSVTTTAPMSMSAEEQIKRWEEDIQRLQWRANSAGNTAKTKAEQGDMGEADKWANHAGELLQQIEVIKKKIRNLQEEESEKKNE